MIRNVLQEDLEACVELIRKSFLTVAEEFDFTPENASRFTAFSTTLHRLNWHLNGEHRPMYVYIDQGSIVGYYSLLLQEGGACELNNLCVSPEYRHRGIGEALLLHSFDTARSLGCDKINIGIVEENAVLKDWYLRYGFIHKGTEKFDFFPFTCGYMDKKL